VGIVNREAIGFLACPDLHTLSKRNSRSLPPVRLILLDFTSNICYNVTYILVEDYLLKGCKGLIFTNPQKTSSFYEKRLDKWVVLWYNISINNKQLFIRLRLVTPTPGGKEYFHTLLAHPSRVQCSMRGLPLTGRRSWNLLVGII